MKVVFVVFSKTLHLSPIKTRLADSFGEEFANEFYERSVFSTLEVLESIKLPGLKSDTIIAVAEEDGLNNSMWEGRNTLYQGKGELGERLERVYKTLIKSYDLVCFLGGDSPHLSRKYLEEEIEAFLLKEEEFLLGPAEDGGYYFFAGKKDLRPNTWLNVNYSSSTTFEDFKRELIKEGRVLLLKQDFDIDKKEDLLKLNEVQGIDFTEKQYSLLNWLKNLSIV